MVAGRSRDRFCSAWCVHCKKSEIAVYFRIDRLACWKDIASWISWASAIPADVRRSDLIFASL